jgi:hypothetical protein
VPLGKPGSAGFFDRYASALAGRNRKPGGAYTVGKLCDDFQDSREFAAFKAGTRGVWGLSEGWRWSCSAPRPLTT